MKYVLLVSLFVSSFSSSIFANVTKCSNSVQSLSYSHQQSNGGANLNIKILNFEGHRQIASHGDWIDFATTAEKVISEVKDGENTIITYYGFAKGAVQVEDQLFPFSEWVICTRKIEPMCDRCP